MSRRIAALAAAGLLLSGVLQAEPAGRAPVDPAIARQAVEQILEAWNTPALNYWLAPDFVGRDRLLAALSFDVPPTARLRILGIGGIQTLQQERARGTLVSLVAVTVNAQAEWEEPQQGLQRRQGSAEYIVRIERRVPR
jgi:hypothetical protein